MTMYLRNLTRFYVGPAAAGLNDGSSPANCWQVSQFSAWAAANPTLAANSFALMIDGHYTAANAMIAPSASVAGKPGGYVNYMAINDGNVEIDGGGTLEPVNIFFLGNDWIAVRGVNAHSSIKNCFQLNRTNWNYLSRCVGWDAGVKPNVYTFQVNYGANNVVEDCAGFGTGRKHFLAFSTWPSNTNTFRRCWGRWQQSTAQSPKITYSATYHSYGTLAENVMVTWDDTYYHNAYPSGHLVTWDFDAPTGSYLNQAYTSATNVTVPAVGVLPTNITWTLNAATVFVPGNRVRMWSSSGGDSTVFCEGIILSVGSPGANDMQVTVDTVAGSTIAKADWICTQFYGIGPVVANGAGAYMGYQANWAQGQDGNTQPGENPSNHRILGLMTYQKTGQQCSRLNYGDKLLAMGVLTNQGGVTVKDYVAYAPPGYGLATGAIQFLNCTGGSGAGLTATNVTSFNDQKGTNPSIYQNQWVLSNVQEYTGTADAGYSGQTLYTADGTHGAALRYRYINGVLKNGGDGFLPVPLWPWPMNARIKTATQQSGYAVEDLDAWRMSQFGKSPDE